MCAGVFPLQGVRQIDGSVACIEILLMEHPDASEMLLQGIDKASGQDRHAVFLAFAVADSDLTIGEIEVLNP
jgi:hypothetical protein